jgi:hypothetical protein
MPAIARKLTLANVSHWFDGSNIDASQEGGDFPEFREAVMNEKVLLLVVALLFAGASPVFSQQAPPQSEHAKQTEVLVNKAAALVDKDGKSAFVEFRKKNSEWFHGTTYLFAYDLKGNVLLNPAFPEREGTNVTGQKDAKGKLFHNEIIKTAETKGAGWVDYMFPKPGQTEPSQKWAYVRKVTVDGFPGLIASGFYPE